MTMLLFSGSESYQIVASEYGINMLDNRRMYLGKISRTGRLSVFIRWVEFNQECI